jgi:hypothetical protein
MEISQGKPGEFFANRVKYPGISNSVYLNDDIASGMKNFITGGK